MAKDRNTRLDTWIHLDWAKAYKMQGKIDESIKEGCDFYEKAQAMQSPHALTRAKRFARGLMRDYNDVQLVKNFYEEVNAEGGEA